MKKSENTEGNIGIQLMMAIRAEARIQNFFGLNGDRKIRKKTGPP